MYFLEWKILYHDSDVNDACLYSPIDNNSVLLRVKDWRRTRDKPLPETMVIKSIDIFVAPRGSIV